MRRLLTIIPSAVLLLALLLLASACEEYVPEAVPGEGRLRIGAGLYGATKGTLLGSVPDQFSVWGYVWPDTGAMTTPQWMCGETFTKDGTAWYSALPHGNIPQDYSIRLWAVAPVAPSGVTSLPLAATSGTPSFSMITPSDVASQQDLITAYGAVCDEQPATFPLVFRHVLTCVLFRTSETNVPACTLNSITLSGVRNEGTYTEGSDWGSLSGLASFSITPSQALTPSDTDIFIGTSEMAMVLLPQTLPAGALLTVNYTQDALPRTLTADLSGLELPIGCKVVLRLEFPSTGGGELTVTVTANPWSAGYETTLTM